jgi:hypothetical protein
VLVNREKKDIKERHIKCPYYLRLSLDSSTESTQNRESKGRRKMERP